MRIKEITRWLDSLFYYPVDKYLRKNQDDALLHGAIDDKLLYKSCFDQFRFFLRNTISMLSALQTAERKCILILIYLGLPAVSGCPKKGPKLLLRAFCFSYIGPSPPKSVHNQSLQLWINPCFGRIRTKYKVKVIYTIIKESKSIRWVYSYRHRWALSNSPIHGPVLTGGDFPGS